MLSNVHSQGLILHRAHFEKYELRKHARDWNLTAAFLQGSVSTAGTHALLKPSHFVAAELDPQRLGFYPVPLQPNKPDIVNTADSLVFIQLPFSVSYLQ